MYIFDLKTHSCCTLGTAMMSQCPTLECLHWDCSCRRLLVTHQDVGASDQREVFHEAVVRELHQPTPRTPRWAHGRWHPRVARLQQLRQVQHAALAVRPVDDQHLLAGQGLASGLEVNDWPCDSNDQLVYMGSLP